MTEVVGSWLEDSTILLQGPQTLEDWGPLTLSHFVQKSVGDFPYQCDGEKKRGKEFSKREWLTKKTFQPTKKSKTPHRKSGAM